MLHDVEGASVVALLAESDPDPATRLARDLGIQVALDVNSFIRENFFDVVIETGGEASPVRDESGMPIGGLEIAGGAACQLLLDLFATRRLAFGVGPSDPDDEVVGRDGVSGEQAEQDRSVIGVEQGVFPASRGAQSPPLRVSGNELNPLLGDQLAEMFFAHEFSKALSRYTAVDDVCSLMVDGLAGLLGADISCAYLLEDEGGTLRLQACQGVAPESLAQVVSTNGTFLGAGLRTGFVQETEVTRGDFSAQWRDSSLAVASQAVVPLKSSGQTLGVALVAFATPRELAEAEVKRFETLAGQAAVSLKSALLLAEVERSSITDRITQLHSESHFMRCLEDEFDRCSRFLHSFSLVLFELDEACGVAAGSGTGDRILREVSSVIRRTMRNMDIAGRLGSSTLAVLLPETGPKGAQKVAERIRSAVESSDIIADGPRADGCTVSAGIATFPQHAGSVAELLSVAGQTLGQAVAVGNNRVGVAAG
jgi:diguanylate cyclase (GGDEF)-like protein